MALRGFADRELVLARGSIEEKLIAEIDARWPAEGLTPANVMGLAYTRQVIEESLRVYPSIWSIGRRCTEADAKRHRPDQEPACRLPVRGLPTAVRLAVPAHRVLQRPDRAEHRRIHVRSTGRRT